MSESKVILVTGASSGFGALTVRTLADANHVVYVGMRDVAGRNQQSAADALAYADEHGSRCDRSRWTYPIRRPSIRRLPRYWLRQAGSTC